MATPYNNYAELATNPICFDVEQVLARPPTGSLQLWPPVVARRRTSAWCLGWEPLAALSLVVASSLAAAALPFVFWVAAAL